MQIYEVGGAVRDELLGLPVKDRDYVVVGATPQQMLDAGYRPVGRDFPVFLHPQTHEEYALARTERKTARGYAGFAFHAAPDVTLEQDLERRDLTINAIARGDDGVLIDPFGGQRDIEARVLRHVGTAFIEDPVRVLRIARFAARFADFTIAPETQALMATMVANGEVDALVAERVWQEVSRGLMEAQPVRMFETLRRCGALARLLPELECGGAQAYAGRMQRLQRAAASEHKLTVRFAVLVFDIGEPAAIDALCERLRVPVAARDLARLLALAMPRIDALAVAVCEDLPVADQRMPAAEDAVALLEHCDAFRKPARFAELLAAWQVVADDAAHSDARSAPLHLIEWLERARAAASAIDAGAIARSATDPTSIKARIHAGRIDAVAALAKA